MALTAIKKEEVHLIWPLIKTLRYDNLLDALIHGFHGEMKVDTLEKPTVFLAWIGWNYYLAGDVTSEHAQTVISQIPKNSEIHTTDEWAGLLSEKYAEQFLKKTRYAHTSQALNKNHLEAIVKTLKPNYRIKEINEPLYHQIIKDQWGIDFVGNFKDYEDFKNHGLGYVVIERNTIISGTSSYIRYNGGYEIEIITHKDYRNQGLARIIGAYFTLSCLKKNKVPHWDAAHQASVRLAAQLGFTYDYAYEVYVIKRI